MTIAEDEKKIDDVIAEHPELADDEEVFDAKYVEEHIEFIVPQTDDPSTPAFTFRTVFIGVIFTVFLAAANTVVSFRTVPFTIPAVVAIILAYPLGLFLAAILPAGILNPGPFSIKEHVLIFIMASSGGTPYGLDNVIVQAHPLFMGNVDISFIGSLGFVLVTQFLGYSFSGLTRRFLVKPTAMWWPGNLSTIAIFSSFHKVDSAEEGNRYSWSRTTMFWVAFLAMFVWEWVPQYFAPALQSISIACIFGRYAAGSAPGQLSNFNYFASTNSGVGIFGLTLEWINIQSVNFAQPLWYNLINAAGNIFFLWILTPIFYTQDIFGLNSRLGNPSNTPNSALINTGGLFAGNLNSTIKPGTKFSAKKMYNVSDNYNINLTYYNLVQPVHISSMFALTYASSFLTVTAALVHVLLWYGKDIYRQSMNAFRQIRDEVDALDKHAKMMEAYPDVPDWVYLALLGLTTAGGLLVSLLTSFNMPWWGIFFNIFMVSLFVVPYGSVTAIAGITLYLNVVSEFVIGLMIPGETIAVMAFKSWGTNNLIQALNLSSDLKLGHYLHIPPYAMVSTQFLGTFINACVSTGTAWVMIFNTNDLINFKSGSVWNMYNYNIFYSAGGIWGAIGPQRFFGIGSIYQDLMWCFLIGAVCPILPWAANKYIVKSHYWHYINFAIFFQFGGPSGQQTYIVMPILACLFSQVYLWNRNREFYQKYLFVMGSAFDSAAGIMSLLMAILGAVTPVDAEISYNTFSTFWALNPNTNNVPSDYYCYPNANYNDYDCTYYLSQGVNTTNEGIFCPSA